MAQSLKVLCTEQKLEEIAEAIREKKGVSVKYTLDEMPPAIRSIPTGGDPPTGQIDITDITESGQGNPIDVTNYALAYVNSPALRAENIRRGTVILGVTGTYGPSGTKSVSMATTSVVTEDVAFFENVSIQLSGAANITPENIRSGVTFLGVTGSYAPPTLVGTANPADVRATKSFYSNNYTLQTGTMANATIAVEDYQLLPPETIPYGKYLNIQSGYAPEDRTFKPGKPTLSGNAVESQVLVGRTFYSTDVDTQKTGTMPYATFEKASYQLVPFESLAAGQYLNVTAGYNSEARTYKAAEQTVLTGNANPEDVVFNKTFYSNNYAKQTGTMPTVSIQRRTINPSTGLNYQEDDSGRIIYCVYDLDRAPSVNNRNIYIYNVGADGTLSNNTTASTVDSSERFYLGRGIVWDSGGSSVAGYKWQLWKYQYTNGVVYTTKIKDFTVLTKIGPLNSTYSAGEYFVVDPVVSLTNGNLAIPQEMVPTPTKWGEVNPGEFVSLQKGYNEENRYIQVNGGTLTGNAIASHVLTGETFYSDDYNTKHTGTMPYASFTKGATPSIGALVDELSYGQYVNASIGYNSTVKSFHAPPAPAAGTVLMEESVTITPTPSSLGTMNPNGSGIGISFAPAVSTPPQTGPYVTVRGDINPITVSIPATISAGLVDSGVVSTTVVIPATTGDNVYYPVQLNKATIAIETAGLLPAEFIEAGEYLNIYTGYNSSERTFRAKIPTLTGTASTADVRSGETFYNNSYNIVTGTMPDSNVTVDTSASVQSSDVDAGKFVNIPKGYVGSTLTYYAKHSTLTGDAIAAHVLTGETFYSNDARTKLTGTMPYASSTISATAASLPTPVDAGKYVNIYTGYVQSPVTFYAQPSNLTGNAIASQVLTGREFYSNNPNQKLTGTMPYATFEKASYELVPYETLNAGQYLNVTAGYNSEPKTYRAAAQTSLTGDALPEEVVSGRTFYSNSYDKQTGTMPTVNIRTHAKDPSIGLNYDVDESGRNIYCVFDLDNPPSTNNRNITIFPVDEYGGVDSINVIHSTVDSGERYYLGRKTIFSAVVTYEWELWKYQYTNGVVYTTKIEDYVSGTNVKLGPFNSTYAENEYYVVEGSSNNLQVPQQIVPTPTFGGTIPMGRYLSILKGYNDTNRYYQAASPTLSGDAQPNEVLAGKKFYSDSMTIKTGTLAATTLSASTTIIPVTPSSSQTITIGNTTDVSLGSRQATTPTIPYIYIESGNERSPISGSFAHIAVSPGVVTDTQTATIYTSVEENKLRYYYPLYITGGGGETWSYGDFTVYGTPSGNVSDQNLYVYCTDALSQSAFIASAPDSGTQCGWCESYMGGPSSSNRIIDYYGFYYCNSENNALDTIILLGSSTAGFHIGTDGFLPPPNQTPSNCWGLSLSFATGAVRTYKIKIWYDSATSKIKYKYKSV